MQGIYFKILFSIKFSGSVFIRRGKGQKNSLNKTIWKPTYKGEPIDFVVSEILIDTQQIFLLYIRIPIKLL